ncbi:MAG: hypothetical protein COA71_07830 [SAR86 cluster bacterium]|uniref:Adenylate/guanylate cyclase domain-containing protein n=1 Tax=SAR86 cluster bacterium TaxID=2030880 RepID=A0A2A5CDB4_9GAMM|nr:MAG: hypothetical protein COA71_07830 [SAR86 cluster bacterium]
MNFRFKRIQTRLLFFLFSLLLLVLGPVYILVNSQNFENALTVISSDLEIGAANFDATISRRNESLAIAADALSADFAFKQVYATNDHATILSAMENLLYRVDNADFMVLIANNNLIIADTKQPAVEGEAPTWINLIEQARELDRQGEYPEAAGIVVIDEQPYHLTVLPFLNPDIEAWVAMGFAIDQAFTQEFKDSISADVTVLFKSEGGLWQSNASTVSSVVKNEVLSRFSLMNMDFDQTNVSTFAGEEFVSLAQPIVAGTDSVYVLLQRSLSEQLAPYEALSRTLLTIFALGFVALIVGVLFISRTVTRPVLELVSGAKRIEAGEYQQKVIVENEDEIGQLATAFNGMAEGLAEKEKIRSLLGKVVSKEIADELLSKDIELGGEEREVTILFSDIRGFTTLCEGKSPQDILSLLNEYFSAITKVIEAHGGVVDKFIGDAVMALFGAPLVQTNAASNAVAAGLDMLNALEGVNQRFAARGIAALDIGIGINTGRVVLGNMGSESRLNYTAIGDGVNIASRIEGLCKEKGAALIVSESTMSQAPEFSYQELGEVLVKGKRESLKIYQPGLVTKQS